MRRKAGCTLVSLLFIKRPTVAASKQNFLRKLIISFVKNRKIGGHSPILALPTPIGVTAGAVCE